MPNIRLPDGSSKSFPGPATVAEIGASIGAGLARAALAGKVNGKLVDTSHRIDADADVAIVTERDPEGLEILRHSAAHLLAHAVKELFPDAQVTIGPVIENGFYYDFSYKRAFTPEDLAAIEKKMAEISKRDLPVARKVMPRDQAVALFSSMGENKATAWSRGMTFLATGRSLFEISAIFFSMAARSSGVKARLYEKS